MAWGKSKDEKDEKGAPKELPNEEVPHIRTEERPAKLSEPLPKKELNKDLQKLLDRDDSWIDQIYEGGGEDTTETSFRYAAYASRVRTILLSAHRYVAYTSDIGESFRPIAHPYLIRSAYAVSWAYLIGDVSHEGYKAYVRNEKTIAAGGTVPGLEDFKTQAAQRAVFQSLASMGLPAFTIHSVVRYSGRALKNAKNATIRTWGPIGLGLVVVPFLPYIFDKPVEEAVEWTFYNAFALIGGPKACGEHGSTGRKEFFKEEFAKAKAKGKEVIKEKEL